MFIVYIIQNARSGRKYIGSTENLDRRVEEHNRGKTKSIKSGKGNWIVIHQEMYNTRGDAVKREKQIKSYKGGEAFKKLLAGLVHR